MTEETFRIIRSQRGQAMVEAALVMPFLVFLLFAIVYFGQTFIDFSNSVTAARFTVLKQGRGDDGSAEQAAQKFYPARESSVSFEDLTSSFLDPSTYSNVDTSDGMAAVMGVFSSLANTAQGKVSFAVRPLPIVNPNNLTVKGYFGADLDSWEGSTLLKVALWGASYALAKKSKQSGGKCGGQGDTNSTQNCTHDKSACCNDQCTDQPGGDEDSQDGSGDDEEGDPVLDLEPGLEFDEETNCLSLKLFQVGSWKLDFEVLCP